MKSILDEIKSMYLPDCDAGGLALVRETYG